MITLFSSKARFEVMKLFLFNPENRYYQRRVSVLTGQPIQAVQRELKKLEDYGLLTKAAEGNRNYYKIDKKCPVYGELRVIFLKTAGIAGYLKNKISAKNIQAAFIFGSYAKGEENVSSDIDLFVVGSVKPRQLSTAISGAKKELGREINYVVMSRGEFARKAGEKDHFLKTVLRGKKIFIIGDENELKKLAGKR